MGHSIVCTTLKKIFFSTLIAFFISNIIGNIFLSSSISGRKPWHNLAFVQKTFLKIFHSFLFRKPKRKVLNCIIYIYNVKYFRKAPHAQPGLFLKKTHYSYLHETVTIF